MIRAVLDTNVIVSGVIKAEGPPGRVLAAWFEGRFTVVTAAPLLAEVARVPAYPKIARRYHLSRQAAEAVVATLTVLSDLVELQQVAWRVGRDPIDELFLVCAVQGRADYLVTGDHDLLMLKAFQGVEVISAEAFLRLLRS